MFENHPLRARLNDEIHLRRMPPLAPPLCMTQTVRLVEAGSRVAEFDHVAAMPGVRSGPLKQGSRDSNSRAPDGLELLWERHSEASTATVIAPSREEDPFATQDQAALEWLEAAPGAVLRATRIAIVATVASAERLLPGFGFSQENLVSCWIGETRIWSDFRLGADGYGRLLVASGDILPADLGRTVQRLQELGNYRNLALLGLPLSQEEGVLLGELEAQLGHITQRIPGASPGAEAALLDELCELSAQAAAIGARTSFRMSATQAYAQIAHDRLESLASRPIEGFQSLADFTDRRMLPAVRTCASFVQRLEGLSVRIERCGSLLRTRVELAMQASNATLLRSMDTNAARQLELQKLVERLSVIAVSYYAFSLLAEAFPLAGEWLGVSEADLRAWFILPVIATVAIYLHWRSRSLGRPT